MEKVFVSSVIQVMIYIERSLWVPIYPFY